MRFHWFVLLCTVAALFFSQYAEAGTACSSIDSSSLGSCLCVDTNNKIELSCNDNTAITDGYTWFNTDVKLTIDPCGTPSASITAIDSIMKASLTSTSAGISVNAPVPIQATQSRTYLGSIYSTCPNLVADVKISRSSADYTLYLGLNICRINLADSNCGDDITWNTNILGKGKPTTFPIDLITQTTFTLPSDFCPTDGGNTDGGNTDGGNTDGGNTDGGNGSNSASTHFINQSLLVLLGSVASAAVMFI